MKGLADGVTTDLAILRHLYDEAQQMPSSQAIELLWQGLELVEGPPFDADGYDWAHHGTQDVAEASSLIERSAAQLVELALNVDDVEHARARSPKVCGGFRATRSSTGCGCESSTMQGTWPG